MFIYQVAFVVILCAIFGITYSLPLVRSAIRLPEFMHRAPLVHFPQTGFAGDTEVATRASSRSLDALDISCEGIEEIDLTNGRLRDDRYQLDRRIIDQKMRDANQIGLVTNSLWPNGTQKLIKNTSEGSKPIQQKINTNLIFNMIQYETFKEAMAVLKSQQELDEAARKAATNIRGLEHDSNDQERDNLEVQDRKAD